ncbi:MAG: hypothetical protein DVB23_001596 [Verrucomicrobia bacterium]|nr:MAG: hypothetical protein DVB23_001596 [Verrucomicrobiota bacterium]
MSCPIPPSIPVALVLGAAGLFAAEQAPPPHPAESFQTIRLYKHHGTIRLMVNDVIEVALADNGKTFGPVWAHFGWIGSRQITHTVRCESDDLALFSLKSGL